jgi:hypothetical protein
VETSDTRRIIDTVLDIAELFAIAVAAPKLDGALCCEPQHRRVFDSTATTAAVQICQQCPCIGPCAAFYGAQKWPPGVVVAGIVVTPRRTPKSVQPVAPAQPKREPRKYETPSERWLRRWRASRAASAQRRGTK